MLRHEKEAGLFAVEVGEELIFITFYSGLGNGIFTT